jgi:methionyl-tRNA formyltransferase
MRIIFAGTPQFARTALEVLIQSGHEVVLVLTQPDRPAGRGMKLTSSSVKQYALSMNLPLIQPRSLRLDGGFYADAKMAQEAIHTSRAEVIIVVAYGLILPPWMLAAAPKGCFNIHASLLPRWRGAAPIARAIEAGDAETGVTIMHMEDGLDTGDIVVMTSISIAVEDTSVSLHDKLSELGAQLMVQVLGKITHGDLPRIPQPAIGICYAKKIEKIEASIDWWKPAVIVTQRIRAFNPAPGAYTMLAGQKIKIWTACYCQIDDMAIDDALPGKINRIDATGIAVLCGDGQYVVISELQRAGGKRLLIVDFLRGFNISVGDVFSNELSSDG